MAWVQRSARRPGPWRWETCCRVCSQYANRLAADGTYMAAENVREHLIERTVQPLAARRAAAFQMASQMLLASQASILGLSPPRRVVEVVGRDVAVRHR